MIKKDKEFMDWQDKVNQAMIIIAVSGILLVALASALLAGK